MYLGGPTGRSVEFSSNIVGFRPYFWRRVLFESRMPWKNRLIVTSAGSWNQLSND
jgi:hypothetical protein